MTLGLLAFALGAELASWDLETSDGGFTSYGDTAQWAWGEVRKGPGSGYDGRFAWGTGLVADYLNDSVDYLELPPVDLSGASRPILVFVHWYAFGAGDSGTVEVDGGWGWTEAQPVYGYPSVDGWSGASSGWEAVAVDLSTWGDTPRVRLAFSADAAGTAAGWFVDDVGFYDGDVVAPRIASVTALADTEDYEGPYLVRATVEDDVGVEAVELHWSVDGGTEVVSPMADEGDGTWSGVLPGQLPGARVAYHVQATDGVNLQRYPEASDLGFRVYLAAPTELRAAEARVGTTVDLSWSSPDSAHPVRGYRVYRDGTLVVESTATVAAAPVTGDVDTFRVHAVYDAGEGDPSDPVTVAMAVPEVLDLRPATAWPGETVRALLEGRYLLLVEGEVAVEMGEGIAVTGVDVRDVDHAWVEMELAADAVPGPRDLVLESAAGTVTGEGALEVLDAATRPRLTAIEPEVLAQGAIGALTITWTGELAATPTVDLGEGVVVESVTLEGADTLTVMAAVANDAPLGEREVVVDDGVRRLEGVGFTVSDVAFDAGNTCGCGVAVGGGGWPLVGLAAVLARRRHRPCISRWS